MALHLLVVEGNTRADRAAYREGFGLTASESYARTLTELAPDARCDIVCPADEGANLPGASALGDYDGVFITGSALNLYDGGREITRQIELARAVFAAKVPFFGSCWGLQVATAAAGGEVIKNPVGRGFRTMRPYSPRMPTAPCRRRKSAMTGANSGACNIIPNTVLAKSPRSSLDVARRWRAKGWFPLSRRL